MTRILTIRLPICNVFLVQGAGAILIDTGRPQDAQAILTALKNEGLGPGDLKLILQTHGHWDHCGSTRELQGTLQAPVAIHRADADMMRRGDNGILKPATMGGRLLRRLLDRRYPGADADIHLDGDMDLAAFGIQARVVATPGHTAGSMSLLTRAGEAIVGDLVMGGYLGGRIFPGRPNLHYFAEDLPLLRTSLRKLLDLGAVTIFPGHGGPLKPARIRERLLAV